MFAFGPVMLLMGVNIGARWCIDDMVLHRCMPITNNTPFLSTSNHPAIYDLLVDLSLLWQVSMVA